MFERFNDPARRVLVVAQEKAREYNAAEIRVGHLMLALADEGLPGQTLGELGITPEVIEKALGLMIEPTRSPQTMPFAPTTKKALEFALREALQLASRDIQPVHLLLGICRLAPPETLDWERIRFEALSKRSDPEKSEKGVLTRSEQYALLKLDQAKEALQFIEGPDQLRIKEHITTLRRIVAQNVAYRLFPEQFSQ